jgi:hypothetical protein
MLFRFWRKKIGTLCYTMVCRRRHPGQRSTSSL